MRKRGRTIPPLGLLMVDVKEAAAMLSIGESTVWKKVKEDPSFPRPVRLSPKCTRFKVDDIRKWVKSVGRESQREFGGTP